MTAETRRLAAIVAGDAVGYSRLMDRDERATLSAVSSAMETVVGPAIQERGGRIFKTTGDGFLAAFDSAAAGGRCALEIQNRLSVLDLSVGDTSLVFRIAVHLGDVLKRSDDVYGNAVNVAVRMQRFANPGGVVISEDVLHQLDEDNASAFTSVGPVRLRNIGRSVELWTWNPNRVTIASSGTPGTYLLPAILADVRRRYPAIEVAITITNSGEAWQALLAQHADLALTGGISGMEGLSEEVLADDEIVVVGPADAPASMAVDDLSEETWIFREAGSASRHTAEVSMAAAGLHPTRRFELPTWETVKLAVAHGLGYTACSRAGLEVELKAGVLRVVEVPG